MQFATEFIELVSVVGYMSNMYEYVTVLGMMQDSWNRRESQMLTGGLVHYMFRRIIGLVGAVTGGTGRRCQTFLNRDFLMKDICDNCLSVKATVRNLVKNRNHDFQGHTPKTMRKSAEGIIGGLSGRCNFMGPMTVTHIIHPLCLMLLGPVYLVNFAMMNPNATQNQPKNMSPALSQFISTQDIMENTKNKADRLSVLLSSLTRFLRVKCKCPHLSEATAENILCEASRKMDTFDLFYAGHWFHRELPATGVEKRGAYQLGFRCANCGFKWHSILQTGSAD
jgi:hypothetical protein